VYETHGVIHYAVGNMPGAVPNTSTYALTNATLPYQLQIATLGAREAAAQSESIRLGVNTANGHITSEPVARELSMDFVRPEDALR
jgi:alanine dehydrogenase